MADRCRESVSCVYGGDSETKQDFLKRMKDATAKYYPSPNEYNIYFGELHGHTNLSDGSVDIYSYFMSLRDTVKLDFAALTDHDHGGVGSAELFGDKRETIKSTVKKYNEPGKFTTILAYERDSYPWYTNMIIYIIAMMVRCSPENISAK